MGLIKNIFIKNKAIIHSKFKNFIIKSLVYFFIIKELFTFSKKEYQDFEHLLDKYNHLFCIGHRGFSGEYPENTLLSFKKAIEEKVDMMELDITISKDVEIVVFHDVNLLRICGLNKNIKALTFAEINDLDAGSWFDLKYKGLKIPKLIEVFELLGEDTFLNIEIKHEASSFFNRNLEKKVISLIKEYKMEKKVILSSFNPMIVNRIRKLAPEISTAYLITQTMNFLLVYLLSKINAKFVYIDFNYLTPKNIKKLKKAGLKIMTYTLNSDKKYKKALELKVDGIFTDYPNKLNKFLLP